MLSLGTVLYGAGSTPLAQLSFLGISILAYIRFLPLIAAQIDRYQERLLQM